MLASGIIIRIKKGLYCFNKDFRKEPLYREYLANLIYGLSYIQTFPRDFKAISVSNFRAT